MTEEEKGQFNEMIQKVNEVHAWMVSKKEGASVEDASRKAIGLGFIGRTADTVPTGGLLVNTNEGPVILLRA